ncbi:MAG: DoxX family protein [Verrucomicrobiaceae bacterium]|nr:MAG: DoxX family protein [Verrucomicrobiaceae bacterium]
MRPSLWMVNLGFIPHWMNVALLFLRVTLGGSVAILHGWPKFIHFQSTVETFPDPLGMGRHFTLGLAAFTELLGGAMLAAGVLTRLSAAALTVLMGVIFFQVQGGDVSKPGSELALVYFFGFVTLLLTGGGRFSADEAGGPYALAGLGLLAGGIAGYPLSYYLQAAEYKASNTMGGYLASISSVLRDPATQTTAWAVWLITMAVLATAGFMIGRLLHRRVIHTTPGEEVVVTPGDSPP